MKAQIAFAMALALGAPAQAKLTPRDAVVAAPSTAADDAVMYAGPIGAMLETNYFRAAHSKFGGSDSCRPHFHFSDQRLARSCE